MSYRVLFPALAFAALFSGPAPQASEDQDESDSEALGFLMRPPDAPDPDATGCVKVEDDSEPGDDELRVKAQHLGPGLPFQLFLEDGNGVMQFVGSMQGDGDDDDQGEDDDEDEAEGDDATSAAGESEDDDHEDEGDDEGEDEDEDENEDDDEDEGASSGAYEIEFEGELPFGAFDVSQLFGRRIEIRLDGSVYLAGFVPSTSGVSSEGWHHAGCALSRPEDNDDDDCNGEVEVREKAKGAQVRFRIRGKHIDDDSCSLFVESSPNHFVDCGKLHEHGNSGQFELKSDSKKGQPLPLGAMHLEDLAGRRVEVRGPSGTLLMGEVPSLDDSKKQQKAEVQLGAGELRLLSQPKVPNEEMDLRLKKLGEVDEVLLLIANPGTGVLTQVAAVDAKGNGQAKWRVRTKDGDMLPFGVAAVADLSGLAFEVRDASDASVLFSGTLP